MTFHIIDLIVLFMLLYNSCYCEGFSTAAKTSNDYNAPRKHRSDRSISQESYREYCDNCNRPLPQCLCRHLPAEKIELETKVLVLQHPVEFRRKTISTVPVMKLVLKQCQVLVGRSFDVELDAIINAACNEGRIPLLLFPGPNATVLDDAGAMKQLQTANTDSSDADSLTENGLLSVNGHAKYLLVIVDGTWTQAKRMVRNSPILMKQCKPVQFTGSDELSIYDAIRKQPDSHCLSTLESCVRTLKLLEPNNSKIEEASTHLLDSLRSMILTQLQYEEIHLGKNPDLVRNSLKLNAKKERQKHFLSTTNRLSGDKILPDGYALRPLVESDSEYVDGIWQYSSKKSLVMIRKQIAADILNCTATVDKSNTCLGIEYEDKLVACLMRHTNGSIGILHVDEEHRRKGLAEALVSAATKALQKKNDPIRCFIVEGNEPSEFLFTKLGWEKMYSGKKGTGKRRAKRLWEFKGN